MAVCAAHGVGLREVLGSSRARTIVDCRHQAMWEIWRRTSMSLPQIGLRLGRDHTSVLHAVRKLQARWGDGTTPRHTRGGFRPLGDFGWAVVGGGHAVFARRPVFSSRNTTTPPSWPAWPRQASGRRVGGDGRLFRPADAGPLGHRDKPGDEGGKGEGAEADGRLPSARKLGGGGRA
jgi:hypothetical protein